MRACTALKGLRPSLGGRGSLTDRVYTLTKMVNLSRWGARGIAVARTRYQVTRGPRASGGKGRRALVGLSSAGSTRVRSGVGTSGRAGAGIACCHRAEAAASTQQAATLVRELRACRLEDGTNLISSCVLPRADEDCLRSRTNWGACRDVIVRTRRCNRCGQGARRQLPIACHSDGPSRLGLSKPRATRPKRDRRRMGRATHGQVFSAQKRRGHETGGDPGDPTATMAAGQSS